MLLFIQRIDTNYEVYDEIFEVRLLAKIFVKDLKMTNNFQCKNLLCTCKIDDGKNIFGENDGVVALVSKALHSQRKYHDIWCNGADV